MEVNRNMHEKIYIYVYKIINLQFLESVNTERPFAFLGEPRNAIENNSHPQTGSVRKACFARAIIDPCKAGIYKNLDDTKTDASYWHAT